MKKLALIILFFLLSNCSFDTKTGIWENSQIVSGKNEDERFKDFTTLENEDESFNSIVRPMKNLQLIIEKPKNVISWIDEFYNKSNNYDNFTYKNLNELIFKSNKISKHTINQKILFDNQNIFLSDNRGNIIVYSISLKKIIYKFNFYQKKYKKLEKKIKLTIEKNIIYVSDNIGHIYALNYKTNKVIWAKNYKIPFRSNLKLTKKLLLVADQNNNFYLLNKLNGEIARFIPTEETTLKNDFINSIGYSDDIIYFLNTYGSLYSINEDDLKINWFINLNKSVDINAASLFYSNPIIINKDKVIVSTTPYLYVFDAKTGVTSLKLAVSSIVHPIISGNNLFLVTKNNLLVCLSTQTGKVIYSLNISEEIGDFLNIKSKQIFIKSLIIVNSKLSIFLQNSYLTQLDVNGKVTSVDKLPQKLNSFPIFINDSILYLNNKNKLIILN